MAESDGEPLESGGSADEAVHQDIPRKEVTEEDFGSSIRLVGGGSSRWFRGEPFVTRETVAPDVLRWMCPMPACGGQMRDTGMEWQPASNLVGTTEPGNHHQCDRCEFMAAIRGEKYPRIEYPPL